MHGQYAMIDYATSKTPYVYIECYIKAIFKDVARGSGWGGRAVPLGLSPPIGGGAVESQNWQKREMMKNDLRLQILIKKNMENR